MYLSSIRGLINIFILKNNNMGGCAHGQHKSIEKELDEEIKKQREKNDILSSVKEVVPESEK